MAGQSNSGAISMLSMGSRGQRLAGFFTDPPRRFFRMLIQVCAFRRINLQSILGGSGESQGGDSMGSGGSLSSGYGAKVPSDMGVLQAFESGAGLDTRVGAGRCRCEGGTGAAVSC